MLQIQLNGHVQAVCKNPRRCLHCNVPGHIIRDCPSRPKGKPKVAERRRPIYKSNPQEKKKDTPVKNLSNIPKKEVLTKKATTTNPLNNMAIPHNWFTMPMNEAVVLWQDRPLSLNVYISPRAELGPANKFLERSAFIFAGPGSSDPHIKRRIASCMARQFHYDPAEFVVHTIDEEFGVELLIFPN